MRPLKPDWRQTGGTARFVKCQSDISRVFSYPNGADGVPLGLNKSGSNYGPYWKLTASREHALAFGSTGSGKGASCIAPAALAYAGSCVILDTKAECAALTAERRRALGQRVVLIDPWDHCYRFWGARYGFREKTTRFNPMSFLDPDSRHFAEDVASIAEALIITPPGDHNSHFPDSARQCTAAAIALVKEVYGSKGSLRQVRDLLLGPMDGITELMVKAKRLRPNSFGVRKMLQFVSESNEINSVRSTAKTQLAFLDSDELIDSMETDENPFNMDEICTGNRRVTVYLVLPPDKLIDYGRWLRLVTNLALRAIARQLAPPELPVLLILDEMGTIGPLKAISAAYGLLGAMGVRLYGFLQDLTQLQGDYPDKWETFISNSGIIQLLSVGDDTTMEYFSKRLGTTTTWDWGNLEQPFRTPSGSRPIMFPHELENLLGKDPKENYPPRLEHFTQLIIFKNRGPVLALQNPYFRERRWNGKYRRIYGPPVGPPQSASANDNAPSVERGGIDWEAVAYAAGWWSMWPVARIIRGVKRLKNWKYRFVPPPVDQKYRREQTFTPGAAERVEKERREALLQKLAANENSIGELRSKLRKEL